jgi:hypothetical protein
MLLLAAFAAIALLAAGLFAVTKGDTFIIAVLLVIVVLVMLVLAPRVPTVMAYIHHAIDTNVPMAFQ